MKTETYIMEENGKRFRIIQAGETLEDGDEIMQAWKHGMPWGALDAKHYGAKVSTHDAYPQGYYRRPIQ